MMFILLCTSKFAFMLFTVLSIHGTLCEAVTCTEHPSVPNGTVDTTCTYDSAGTPCNITCKDGYYVNGTAMATCVVAADDGSGGSDTDTDGVWDYGYTKCTPITCETSPNVPNGFIADECGIGSEYNETCQVTCYEGYYISGDEEVTCVDKPNTDDTNRDGQWADGDTTCTAMKCGELPNFPNGEFGDECSSGSEVNTTCFITCNDGYYRNGGDTATCVDADLASNNNVAGEWYYDTSCAPVTCTEDPRFSNGTVDAPCQTNSIFGTSCYITCDEGYYLNGTGNATCVDTNKTDDTNEDGEWNYGNTACIPITCETSPEVQGGYISDGCDSGSLYDATCQVTCYGGYYIGGDGVVTCIDIPDKDGTNKEGEWTDGDTTCTAMKCGVAPNIPNGDYREGCFPDKKVNETCTITCNDGYYRNGSNTVECIDPDLDSNTNSDGEWNYDTACIPITCETSPNVPNGFIADECVSGSEYNETCQVACYEGYYISGEEKITCADEPDSDDTNPEGEWNNGNTTCTAMKCGVAPNIPNGKYRGGCSSDEVVNATCTITCNDGYYRNGSDTVKCIDPNLESNTNMDGEWNYDTACLPITCETSPSVPNGFISDECNSGSEYNETCQVTCYEGYYISGEEKITCADEPEPDDANPEGEWNYGNTTCTAMKCGELPNFPTGDFGTECSPGSNVNTTCEITCKDGYYMNGGDTATCVDDDLASNNNMAGDWEYDTTCTPYMVLNIDTLSSAVKGMDTNLTVRINSSPDNLPIDISVFVISSPNNSLNGMALEQYSYNDDDGFFTYGITITNVVESDEGNYEFESSASSESDVYPNVSFSGMQYLYVQVIPENFQLYNNETVVNEDITYVRGASNSNVTCSADGNPEPDYKWGASDAPSLPDGVSTNKQILNLENSYFSDNGTYVCGASNNVSEEYNRTPNRSLYIEIEGIPVIISENQKFSLNDDFHLQCTIDANPMPSMVAWSTGGEEYNDSENAFATTSNIENRENGSYYEYQNELALYSQLCVGKQIVECKPSNNIGQSETSVNYTLNEGAYDLHQDSMTYITYPSENFTKAEADEACNLSSGHLVYITSDNLQQFLDTRIDYEYYIGAVKDAAGNWTWGENGEAISQDNLTSTAGNGSCAISSVYGWKVVDCNETFRYVCQLTASGYPKDVQVTTHHCEPRLINVSWEAADDRFETTQYLVNFTSINSTEEDIHVDTISMESSPQVYNFSDAKPNTEYRIELYAAVDVCLPEYRPMEMRLATTGFDMPDKVRDASMSNVESNDVCSLSWSYNEEFQWQIESYQVEINETEVSTNESRTRSDLCNPGVETSCMFDMQPNSRYSASITAKSSCDVFGEPVVASDSCESNVAAPEELFVEPVSGNVDARNGFTITVLPQDERNGIISCIFIYVTVDDSADASNNRVPNNRSLETVAGESRVYASNKAAEGFKYTVGADQSSSSCVTNPTSRRKRAIAESSQNPVPAQNIELKPNKFYRYYLKSTTPNGTEFYIIQASELSEVPIETNYYAWIAAIVVPLFLIGVAIAFYFWYKRRKPDKDDSTFQPESEPKFATTNLAMVDPVYDELNENFIRPPPPNLLNSRDLKQTYEHKCRDDFRLLRDEFKKVKDAARQLDDNFKEAKSYRGLNRFVNILPAKDHRVRITPSQENSQGFINASYIAGYKQEKKFIATQGPKPNTIADFWQMIWEHNVEAIVMLTNVDENGKRKCEKYWPETSETFGHGSIEIIGKEQSECGPIIVRKFSIKDKKAKTARDVTQYHYVSWPDHGVPLTTSDLFNLRRIVNLECRGKNPIVVHCSAGVGRTGTFISLDYNLDDLATTLSVDITSQMWAMRERRTEMIQTSDQFILVHKMILERHLMGETDIDVARLEELMSNNGLSDDHLETEFEKISKVKPTETDQDISSRFYHLNRDPSVIPYDRNIAAIRMRPEDHTAPYLNASFIPGYSKEDKFIVTQDPLPDTEELFWRMALDNNVSCVVMIRKRGESQDISAKYWADRQSIEFGKVTVSVLETFMERNFTQRKIFLREVVLTSARSSNITHFEFTEWPENPAQGADPLLELIGRVQKERAAADAGHGPVILHCGNGSEYVGALCAIANIVERIKNESRVDVVRAVKDLRDMRPQMVSSLDEYKVCYAAVRSYLDTFNTYANFQ